MDKVFKPEDIEDKWYKHWLDKGYFHAEVNPKKDNLKYLRTKQKKMGHMIKNIS